MTELFSQVDISLPSGQGFTGLFCQPAGVARGAVLLIQEIFGLNENMRRTAQAFADRGFYVLAPDLFWRLTPHVDLNPAVEADRVAGMSLNQRFDDVTGLEDLRAAAARLKSLTGTTEVYSVGYCMGGRLSFALGAEGAVAGAISYYGVALDRYFTSVHQAPTLVHIAGEDAMCPPHAQQQILDYAVRSPKLQVLVHPGVGHAFARYGSPALVASAAQAAMARTEAFLGVRE